MVRFKLDFLTKSAKKILEPFENLRKKGDEGITEFFNQQLKVDAFYFEIGRGKNAFEIFGGRIDEKSKKEGAGEDRKFNELYANEAENDKVIKRGGEVAEFFIERLGKKGVDKSTAQFILMLTVGQGEEHLSLLHKAGELIYSQPLFKKLFENLGCNVDEKKIKIDCLNDKIEIVCEAALQKFDREIKSIPIEFIIQVKKDLSSPIEVSFEIESKEFKKILDYLNYLELRKLTNAQAKIDVYRESFKEKRRELEEGEGKIIGDQINKYRVLPDKVFNDWCVLRTKTFQNLVDLYKELGHMLNTSPYLNGNYAEGYEKELVRSQKRQIINLRNEIKSYCIKKKSPFLRGPFYKLGQFFRFIFGIKTDEDKIHDKLVASRRIKVINSSVLKLQYQLLDGILPSQNIQQLSDFKTEVTKLISTTNYYLLPEKDEKDFRENIRNTQRIIEESMNFLKFDRDKSVFTSEIIDHIKRYRQQPNDEKNFIQLAMKAKFVVRGILVRKELMDIKNDDYLQRKLIDCFTSVDIQQVKDFVGSLLTEQNIERTPQNMLNEIDRLSNSLKNTARTFDINSEYIISFLVAMRRKVEESLQESCIEADSHSEILLGLGGVNRAEVGSDIVLDKSETTSERDESEVSDEEVVRRCKQGAEELRKSEQKTEESQVSGSELISPQKEENVITSVRIEPLQFNCS